MIDNFVFRKEWHDVLKGCSADIRQEVYEAIMTYAFEDCVVDMSDMARMAFAFIRPQIDAMRDKYRARCEQNRANASGRNQSQANANDGKRTQASASDGSDNNNNNNNKDNYNSECDSTHTHAVIFEKFQNQCRAVAPLALEFREPLTIDQFAKLYDTYGWQKVAQCATELHNKEAYKKNRRAYTAWQAFITKIS